MAAKDPKPPKKAGDLPASGISILPMQLQVGDRYSDEPGEWEVVSRPVSFRGGKGVRARVQVLVVLTPSARTRGRRISG
jgi:hypothetical protein